jgi:hypothetical protein
MPKEQAVVASIVEMVRSGQEQEDICAARHADGVATPCGDKWSRTMIFRILKRAGPIPERTREYKPRKNCPWLRRSALLTALRLHPKPGMSAGSRLAVLPPIAPLLTAIAPLHPNFSPPSLSIAVRGYRALLPNTWRRRAPVGMESGVRL